MWVWGFKNKHSFHILVKLEKKKEKGENISWQPQALLLEHFYSEEPIA